MGNETNDKKILFERWNRYEKMWTVYFGKHGVSTEVQFSPVCYFSTCNEAHNFCIMLAEAHPELYELDTTFKR
jgi:hypothetical protein